MRPRSAIRTRRTSRMRTKRRELWRRRPSYATKYGGASKAGESLRPEHLQNFIPVVVDDLDGDFAGFRAVERAAGGGVERCPGGLIYFGAERAFQLVVGIVGAREVGVADKKALAVVGRVDEPAGDIVRGMAADFLRGGVVNLDAADFHFQLAVFPLTDLHVRLAEDHEEVAGAGLFQKFLAHEQVGIHADGLHRQFAVSLDFFGHVRVEGEAAHHQQVVAHALDGFLGGFLHVVRPDRAVLRADGDRHAAPLSNRRGVLALGVERTAGERFEAVELDGLPLFRTLDARLPQIVQDDGDEVPGAILALAGAFRGGPVLVFGREDTVRREALDGEGTADADALRILVGLIVEVFGFGAAGDGSVDLLLALAAQRPPFFRNSVPSR